MTTFTISGSIKLLPSGAKGSVESISISENGYYAVATPKRGTDFTLYLIGRGKPPEEGIIEKIPLWALATIIVAALGVVGFVIKSRIAPKVE